MLQRPCSEPKLVVLDAMDTAWDQVRQRLEDLGSHEYRWEPVPHSWSVRRFGDTVGVDGFGHREIDPAPITTIGWRLWHIAVDCLDSYSERLLGTTGAACAGHHWYLEPSPALSDLDRAWRCFRGGIAAMDDARWWSLLGPDWGPFHQHSICDLALHALHEVTHHGAEIALLRDLYRWRSSESI